MFIQNTFLPKTIQKTLKTVDYNFLPRAAHNCCSKLWRFSFSENEQLQLFVSQLMMSVFVKSNVSLNRKMT